MSQYYIGIDLGGTKIAGVVLDEGHHQLCSERLSTPGEYEAIVEAVAGLVRRLWKSAAGAPVGIGTPGMTDRHGRIYNSNTVCLNGRPLQGDLEACLGVPLRLANDANCLALSEATDGVASDAGVVFGVIMGTGVGGGVVVDSRVLTGPHGISGEWGHNVLEPDGPLCYCGKRGCVETFLSGPGMRADFIRAGGEPLDPPAILQVARAGDVRARECLQRFMDRFGRALSVVINILDPDCIVLGGGLSHMAQLYELGPERVRQYVFHPHWQGRIVKNHWGDASGVRGAAWLWR